MLKVHRSLDLNYVHRIVWIQHSQYSAESVLNWIIPLRTSASSTLTEQTIGRGLRLPYGKVTGNDKVDRLSIVSHDKYNEIIKLANDPNSLIRKVFYIDEEENIEKRKEIITSKSGLESQIQEKQESITKKDKIRKVAIKRLV